MSIESCLAHGEARASCRWPDAMQMLERAPCRWAGTMLVLKTPRAVESSGAVISGFSREGVGEREERRGRHARAASEICVHWEEV